MIHIGTNEKIFNDYYRFVNKNYNSQEHTFIFILREKLGEDESFINKNGKILYKKNRLKKLIYLNLYIIISDKILLHSFHSKEILLLLFFQPWLLKKCYWVIWGGDLYSYQKPKITMKQKLYECMRAFCIKRFGGIIALTQGDSKLAKEWYNTNAKEYFGMYINPVKKEYLDNIKTKEKKEIYIQIGNSADSSNNHIEIIDILKKYKNENIKICAPLSYGDKEYAFEVKKYGEEVFGDKFIAMMNFMKPEEYAEYLGSIDILIFNHKRQQGLGNIYALVYLGKKIFIRSDISSWSFFETTLDIKLADTLEIDKIDFESLKSNNYALYNKKRAEETFYSDKYISSLWEKVFRGE